jgi:hypothetical protein
MSMWESIIVDDVAYSGVEYMNQFRQPLGIDPADAPPASVPKVKSYATTHHVSDWNEDTKTVYVKVLDYPISQRSLSDLIGQFRQDGHSQIKFCKVTLEHGGISTGPNIGVIERLGFVRDEIGKFTFTYDYANPRRKQDFTPAESSKPEPELDSWESALKSIRERERFCKENGIWFTQADIDHAAWLEAKIADERAFKNSPAMKALDAEIEEIQKQLDGKS